MDITKQLPSFHSPGQSYNSIAAAEYETLLMSFAQATWQADIAGKIVTDSPSWRAYTGQSLQTWLNEGWVAAVHPDDREDAVRQWTEAVANQHLVNAEFRLQRPDGRWCWTILRATPLLSNDGTVKGWVGVNIDISKYKEDQQALYESELKYHALFNSIDQGYYLLDVIFDQDGQVANIKYLDANLAAIRMSGEDRRGKNLRDVGQYETYWYELFGSVARTGEAQHLEQYASHSGLWVDLHCFRVNEQASRVAVVFQDITERKRREANAAFLADIANEMSRLSTAEEIMTTVGAKVGAYLAVKSCLFVDVDDAQGEVTVFDAWNSNDVPSIRYQTIRLSDFINEEFSHLNRTGQGAVVFDTYTDPRSEGRDFTALGISAFVTVPFHRNGVWTNYLAVTDSKPHHWREDEIEVFRELANRIFPRLERARAEARLREANHRKDQFLAMLGHELRNPLAAVTNTLLLLELTQGKDSSMTYEKGVNILSRHTRHLNRMVDDLLDMSRIRQALVRIQREQVDLTEAVQATIEAARPIYMELNRNLEVVLPAQPLYVCGDETRLSQVIMNLLTNGFKYTNPEGHVWVSLEETDDQVVLRVRDDGIGLARENLNSIFEIFVQGATTLDRPHGGLGLGLAVVKHLVEQHEGQIEAHSAGLGLGSEFVVRLPKFIDFIMPDTSPINIDKNFPNSRRVLVVDDNKDFADTTARLIRLNGYEAYVRYSGAQGLAAAESLRPDVVLLDIGMPYLDGYEVCRQMRKQPWGESVVIIALTGYGRETDKELATDAGFDSHLLKPVYLETLNAAIAQTLK